MKNATALIIPVYNAMPYLARLVPALRALDPAPGRILIIDSSSPDGSGEALRAEGFEVHTIPKAEFGHGKTRNLAARMCEGADHLIYLTQDAIPESPDLVAELCAPFEDPQVGVVYGRQLPYPDASVAARFARLFNYPDTPRRTVAADIATRGLKALFCSNSCAAYRARALAQVGGFPEDLPLGEDLAVTGRLLEAGFASVYAPSARVVHSHNYGIAEEFTRYFDIGALLAVDPWLCARTLRSGGEGMRFVTAEMRYTLKNGTFADLVSIVPRTAAKLLGFKLGHRCRSLPPALIRRVSMHHYYWMGERA